MNNLERERTLRHYTRVLADAKEALRNERINYLAWEAAHQPEIERIAKEFATDDLICERFNEQPPGFYEKLRQYGYSEDYAELGRLVWGTIWADVFTAASDAVWKRLEPVTIEREEHPSMTDAERNGRPAMLSEI